MLTGFFLSFNREAAGETDRTSLLYCGLLGVTFRGDQWQKKKHTSQHEYSHFLAEESDALVFRAASLLRQTELFLVFGVLLLQRLELSARHRQEEQRPLEYEYIQVKQQGTSEEGALIQLHNLFIDNIL